MKKIFLFTILIVLFSSSVFSLVEKYDGKAYDNGEVAIDGKLFGFKISDSSKIVKATFENTTAIIGNNECENNVRYKICAYNISSDFEEESYADIKIYYYSANFSFERTQDKTSIYLGDSINVKLSLENKGDYTASDVEYNDYFPEDILVEIVSGDCILKENSVFYYGIVKRGNKIMCAYKITPKKEVDLKLRAELKYFDGNENKKGYSDLVAIKSNPLFDVKTYKLDIVNENITKYPLLKDEKILIGQKIDIRINLTNLVNETLDFNNFTIILPQGFDVVYSSLKKTEKVYVFNGKISNRSTKEIAFQIVPRIGDETKIIFLADLKKGDKPIKGVYNTLDLDISVNDLILSSSLDDINHFDFGKPVEITFYAINTNNNEDITINNVNIKNPFSGNLTLPKMVVKKNSTMLLYKTSIFPKNESSSKIYTFELNTNYSNYIKQTKSLKKEWKATLEKPAEIEITRSYSKTTITEGESVEIKVYVKNTRNLPIYTVKVNEIFMTPLTRNGKTKTSIEMISPDEKVEAYSYWITAPKAKDNATLIIYTNISYYENYEDKEIGSTDSTLNVLKMMNLTISPKKPNFVITKTSERTKLEVGELQDIKYTLKNNDDKTVYGIKIYYSKSSEYDLYGDEYYLVDKMDPNEEINFINEHIRPKKEGKLYVGTTYVTLNDENLNEFNYSINTLSIEVRNSTNDEPLIFVSKSVNATSVYEGDFVNVTISLENKGGIGTNVRIIDNFKDINTYIEGNSKKNLSYERKILQNNYEKEVRAYYNYNGKEFIAYGEGKTIEVKTRQLTDETPVVLNNNENNVDEAKNEVEQEQILVDEKKGLLASLVDKIKSLFK